jgi:multiple sugar transport system substrate-binding protein
MNHLDRRQFLRVSSAAAAAALLARRGATTGRAAQEEVTLRWWDHYAPLEPLHREIFDAYARERPGVRVEHTLYNLPELGQALQLAFTSEQAPDVHAIASLNVPASRLVAEGWFAPIDDYVGDEFRQRFPPGLLLEGLHTFEGKLYSFPLFGFRSHSSLVWFNRQLMESAGVDPEVGPRTWDEFRQAAAAITEQGGGGVFGWIQAIQLADRLGQQVTDLAHTAGSPGPIDPRTGEYGYHTDPFVQAIEFLLSIQQDGSLFPASTSLDARTARVRFTTGAAGMNFDGPWSIGVIQNDYADFLDDVGVGQIPVPDANAPSYVYRGPIGGDFWVSAQSARPEIAADILQRFNTDDYYVRLAERMDQPPLNPAAVGRATVHPTYTAALRFFDEIIRLAPSPIVRNPAVADVEAEMTDIRPNLGEIVQGLFGGSGGDYRGALRDYSDKLTAERERAIQAVRATGAQVGVEDWIFANWDPARDYTAESYAGAAR